MNVQDAALTDPHPDAALAVHSLAAVARAAAERTVRPLDCRPGLASAALKAECSPRAQAVHRPAAVARDGHSQLAAAARRLAAAPARHSQEAAVVDSRDGRRAGLHAALAGLHAALAASDVLLARPDG